MKITEIVSGLISKVNWLGRLAKVSKDYNGFVSRNTSTITVDGAEVVLTFTDDTKVYNKSNEYSITNGTELRLDTTGLIGSQYIVLRPETMELEAIGAVPNFSEDLLCTYVYCNATGIIMVGDERHGASVDTDWHRAQHLNVGTVWRSGGTVGLELNNDDVAIEVSTPMVIADEDLEHSINNGNANVPYEQVLSGIAELPALYVGANGLYVETAPSPFSLPVGANTAMYNDLATGTLVEAPEDSYITYFIVATNDMIAPIKWVIGRYAHTDLDSAKAEEFSSLGLSLPEIVPMNRVVVVTRSHFPNKIHFVDSAVITNRMGSVNMSYSPSSHESLLGRDSANQHTIGSITGLDAALLEVAADINDLSIQVNTDISGLTTLIGEEVSALEGELALKVSKDSNTGAAILPSGDNAARPAVPIEGMIRFNSEATGFEGYYNGQWQSVGGGQMLGNAAVKAVSYNAQIIDEDIVVPEGLNAYSVGNVSIADGKSITISNNSIHKVL